MKKIIIISLAVIVVLFVLRLSLKNNSPKLTNPIQPTDVPVPQNTPGKINPDIFQPPVDRAKERVTKKMFGTYVTPQNSPVQPERFRGFHTGVDYEIFPEELDKEVSIKAVCNGKIMEKRFVSGYGGVMVQSCLLNKQPITVIYGHLKLKSINQWVNADLKTGEIVGILGKAYSSETNGERKHLHLAFHKGSQINLAGYVSSSSALSGWIDPCLYVCE